MDNVFLLHGQKHSGGLPFICLLFLLTYSFLPRLYYYFGSVFNQNHHSYYYYYWHYYYYNVSCAQATYLFLLGLYRVRAINSELLEYYLLHLWLLMLNSLFVKEYYLPSQPQLSNILFWTLLCLFFNH